MTISPISTNKPIPLPQPNNGQFSIIFKIITFFSITKKFTTWLEEKSFEAQIKQWSLEEPISENKTQTAVKVLDYVNAINFPPQYLDLANNWQDVDLGLSLRNQELKTLPPIKYPEKIKVLDLSDNIFSQALDLTSFKNLTKLKLRQALKGHFPIFKDLQHLQYLNLSNNELKCIDKLPENLSKNLFLDLSDNELTDLPESFFSLPRTMTIILNKNPLSITTKLKICQNALYQIGPEIVLESENICLANQTLKKFPLEHFRPSDAFHFFDLKNNAIDTIPEELFKTEGPYFIDLRNNPLIKKTIRSVRKFFRKNPLSNFKGPYILIDLDKENKTSSSSKNESLPLSKYFFLSWQEQIDKDKNLPRQTVRFNDQNQVCEFYSE